MKLIKIPAINGLNKTKGCEKAPDKVIENLKELYLNEDGMLPFFDIEEIKVNKENIQETNKHIQEKVKEEISNSEQVFILGGDHSITYPCFKAFKETNENPGLIIFDAHPDCVNNFNPPTHEDFLRTLVENNEIKKENIVILGLRNWHKDEYNFIKENKIKYYNMHEISNENIHEISESIMTVANTFKNLYISIDIDVVDPSIAPGTGYQEPGGLTSRELLYLLKRLKLLKNLKVIDLVEINPDKDKNNLTVKLGAKILSEMS